MATDFDFDELDKAVNSALGGTSSDDSNVQASESAPKSDDASVPAPKPAEEPAKEASPPATPPAVRRSGGRFMDVVHPSSDMRANAPASVPVPPVFNRSEPTPTPATTPTPKPVESKQDDDILGEDWNQPLESPFLPDAKVEKRPLGGLVPSQIDFDELELLEEPDDPRIEAHAMPDPIDFAQQNGHVELPEEDAALIVPEPAAQKEEAQPAKPVEAKTDDYGAGYGEGSFQEAPSRGLAPEEEPAGPASIQQQYKEQPSTAPESGSIYDTEAYHKPLIPNAKRKSGIMVIVWILALILIGGGLGAATYFYILPML